MGPRNEAPASEESPRSGLVQVGQALNPARLLGGLVGLIRRGDPLEVKTIETTPYEGQKPGTSGLRKKTKVFIQVCGMWTDTWVVIVKVDVTVRFVKQVGLDDYAMPLSFVRTRRRVPRSSSVSWYF